MDDISTLSRGCRQKFEELCSELQTTSDAKLELMPQETICTLSGRFNVWCGSLAATERGTDSLKCRLRRQDVLQLNFVKALLDLDGELKESLDIVSGVRLPYEEQLRPEEPSEAGSSDDTSSETTSSPQAELSIRLSGIQDLLDILDKMGFHIWGTSSDESSAWAGQEDHSEVIDITEEESSYTELILDHLNALRQERTGPSMPRSHFVQRLISSVTLRKRHLQYLLCNAERSTLHTSADIVQTSVEPESRPSAYYRIDNSAENNEGYSHSLSSIDDSLPFPEPPPQAQMGLEFTCTYCSGILPSDIGTGFEWKCHILQDIRPYICTYDNCPAAPQLFVSKHDWIRHEEVEHRQRWSCTDHPKLIYASPDGLSAHFTLSHSGMFKESDIDELVKVCGFESVDDRLLCPVCLQEPSSDEGLTNHLATHLEEIALSTLPTIRLEDSGDADSVLEQLATLFNLPDALPPATEIPPAYEKKGPDEEIVDFFYLADLCQAETTRARRISKNLPLVHVPAVAETERTIRTTVGLLEDVRTHLEEIVTRSDSLSLPQTMRTMRIEYGFYSSDFIYSKHTCMNGPTQRWNEVIESSSTLKVLKTSSFNSGKMVLYVIEAKESSPYIVLHQKATNLQAGFACRSSIQDITITQRDNLLLLFNTEQTKDQVWAQLAFETYEELKLMHYLLVVLKPHTSSSTGLDSATGHLHGEEMELFTADLEGFQKLGVFVDHATGMVLFESTRRDNKDSYFRPAWIFIAKPEEAFSMKLTIHKSVVRLRDVTCIYFTSKQRVPAANDPDQYIPFLDTESEYDLFH
ncbi:zinc finger protein [Fusarium austroafricanum]|uniref:Zinc finger protein n=1 Tax=Fusarium austroafricanum TaxID=2364996 RepID=A0A8H4K6C7_9HYPO|nr:zinc finger protein [Fusarium austroafricanum]